jgi:hypothetical protein
MYEAFWSLFFDSAEAQTALGERMVFCPFHLWNVGKPNEETPAMSINGLLRH